MDKEQFISVTHFINPQLFWYHKIDVPNEHFHDIIELEKQLSALYKNKPAPRNFRPTVGSVVAVSFIPWNKFVRARVEEISHFHSNHDEYIVWALDYGFPFQSKLDHVRRMPDAYAAPIDHIRCGGLANVLPGEKDFDFMEGKAIMTTQEHWNQRACDSLEKLITDAASVSFIEQFKTAGKHNWGDLQIVNHKGNTFLASRYLIDTNMAIEAAENFPKTCLKLKSITIAPWLSNNGNSKFKSNTQHCTVDNRRLNEAADNKCDDFSKRKVEDWCARNERALQPMDYTQESAADAIDDIAFEDSVSIKKHPISSSSISKRLESQRAHMAAEEGCIRMAAALPKPRNAVPKPPASAFAMFADVRTTAMPLLTPSSPQPTAHIVPATSEVDYETRSEVASSSVVSANSVSQRKQKLLEMRRKLAAKQAELAQLETSTQDNTFASTNNEVLYQPLQESTFNDTNCSEQQLIRKTRTISITDSENNTVEACAPVSRAKQLIEMRRKRAAAANTIAKEATASAPVASNGAAFQTETLLVRDEANSDIASSIGSSKYMEKLKMIKAKQDNASTNKQIEIINNTNEQDDALSTSSYIMHLRNTRKKIKEKSLQDNAHVQQEHIPNNSVLFKKTPVVQQTQARRPEFQFPDLTLNSSSSYNTNNQKSAPTKSFDPYAGMTVVPAGFDLAKLQHYKNEENHWHRKKTTRHDHVPHDDIDINESEELLLETTQNTSSSSDLWNPKTTNNRDAAAADYGRPSVSVSSAKPIQRNVSSNQNFRHTRSHTDKYKEQDAVEETILPTADEIAIANLLQKRNKKQNTLDLMLPPDTTDAAPKSVNATLEECLITDESNSLNSTGDDSPRQIVEKTTGIKLYKRRQLKSPAQQMPKIDQLLRRANFEKQLGNEHVLDLNNLNSNSAQSGGGGVTNKSDSDSNIELSLGEDVNSETSDDLNKASAKSSNTRAFDEKRRMEKSAADKENSKAEELLKYDRLVNQLNFELQLTTPTPTTNTSTPTESLTTTKSTTEKHSTKIIRMPHAHEIRTINGESGLQTKFIDHLVLAHSKVPLHPLEKLSEAFFQQHIHDEMINMRVTKVYRVQAYAWSHLLRNNSLFVVNAMKTGKTWCYLPPICNLISYRLQNAAVPQTYGPVGIIIVPSAMHVEQVNNYCRRLLQQSQVKVTTVASFGVRNTNDAKIQLLNSCGILVTTPATLLRLLKDVERGETLIDAARLQHLVIDDMDLMLSRCEQDLTNVLRTIFKLVKRPREQTIPLQLIVTSRDWNSTMKSLMRWSNQPLLLIGDFLEAAVYGKAEISIKLRPSDLKLGSVLRFVTRHSPERERVLIMCNSDGDLDLVVQALTDAGYACIGYGCGSAAEVRITIDEWKQKSLCSQILVCTDAVLPELKLQNVQNVVHYSMPSSWTKFTTRFATLAKTYANFVANDFHLSKCDDTATHSLILLDEDNNIHLPRLIDFMKKHHQIRNIHPDILAVAKRVLLEREELHIFKGTMLCPFLLEFGECDEPRCDQRHNLTRFDAITKSDGIPTSGDMRIKILKVFSPTHYTARLLEHKPQNSTVWQKLRRSDEVAIFSMQLNVHYMDPDHWLLHWPPKMNDMVIYKIQDTYQRARIIDEPQIKNVDTVQTVRVSIKLIDIGAIINCCKSDELFVCEEKFKEFPAQALDIRLMGVQPFDNERTWDSRATKAVQKWIMTNVAKDECVYVDINFALANTIWVKNVIVMEKLPTVGQYIYRINLKRSLVEKNFGCLVMSDDGQSVRDIAEEHGLLNMSEADEEMASLDDNNDDDDDADGVQKEQEESVLVVDNDDINDSVNLMKFSSNDERILNGGDDSSSENATPQKNAEKENDILNDTNWFETENWDDANGEDEVYVPLTKESKFDKVDTNETDITTKASALAPKHNSPQQKNEESWCSMPLHTLTKVEIGDENENGNWTDIYMQRIDDAHMQRFRELLDLINAHIADEKAIAADAENSSPTRTTDGCRWLQPMENCIVKYEQIYCRAKLHGVFGNNIQNQLYRFFLCDFACFVTIQSDELYNDLLYKTTPEIVCYAPYQAVHCTLTGIKLDQFAKRHCVTKDYLYAYAVLTNEKTPRALQGFNIKSYDILLYECEKPNDVKDAQMLNQALLQQNVATLDADTKHYLELMHSIDFTNFDVTDAEKLKQDIEHEQNNVVSFEQLLQIICRTNELDVQDALMDLENDDDNNSDKQKMKRSLLETKALCRAAIEQQSKQQLGANDETKTMDKALEAAPVSDDADDSIYTSLSDSNTALTTNLCNASSLSGSGSNYSVPLTSSTSTTSLAPPLTALHKRPQTAWYETDFLIYLVIHAPDIKHYYLEVSADTLIFSAIVQGEEQVLILNLLGRVRPEYVSHELRGLNVMVRLPKTVHMKWPRLLQQSNKFSWLTYNYNAIDVTELEHVQPQQRMQLALEHSAQTAAAAASASQRRHSDSEGDEEDNLYQTFTPIVNSEDFHDPTADIY